MSALGDALDSFDDFALLFNRVSGNHNITDFDFRRSINQNRFAVLSKSDS